MKKFLTIVCACLLISLVSAGCGIYDPLSGGSSATSSQPASDAEATVAETKPKEYENTFEGLREYMKDSGYIDYDNDKNEPKKMQANLIGASKGERYTKNTATVELYVYNLNKLNDTAKTTIESVKTNGYFTLYNEKVNAYTSDNGKFLMIYNDVAVGEDDTSSDAYKTMQKAIKAFKKFNA